MPEIKLSRGLLTIVEEEDIDFLSAYKWFAQGKVGKWYAARKIRGADGYRTVQYMHRVILDAQPGLDVDHINGDTLDNRRSNLRLASRALNIANRVDTAASEGGAYLCPMTGRWHARIIAGGRRYSLGRFETRGDAALAYALAARRLRGEFANGRLVPEPALLSAQFMRRASPHLLALLSRIPLMAQ